MLRALESLRAEHQRALEKETERTELWIKEIKKSHATERTQLLERIAGLVRSVGVSTRELTPEGHDPSGTTALAMKSKTLDELRMRGTAKIDGLGLLY